MAKLPDDGKIVVAAPAVAARIAETDPAFGWRVFTAPGVPDDKVYVIDLDKLLELPPLEWGQGA